MSVVALVLIAASVAAVFLLTRSRNRVVALRYRVDNARHQMGVQLARRHDLVPALIDAVKGAMRYEKDTLEALVRAAAEAREALLRTTSRRSQARRDGHPDLFGDVDDGADSLEAETRLSSTLSQTLSMVDQHPELRAVDAVRSLQEELASTENRIAFARQHYNDVATQFNAAREQFPASMFVGATPPAPLWEMPAGNAEMPKIDLSLAA
jgi:LemA protein